ncbi:2183_t:CDS:1, partial [Scutellospora calospora]
MTECIITDIDNNTKLIRVHWILLNLLLEDKGKKDSQKGYIT